MHQRVPPPQAPPSPPPLARLTQVLLIEPDQALAAALTVYLESVGHFVSVVDTTVVDCGPRFVEGYDVAVLDIDRLDETTAAFITACPAPVVICTRSVDPSVLGQLWSSGAQAVLLKPFPMDRFGSALFEAIMG